MSKPIIQVVDLKKDYTNEEVITSVLRGVSFVINPGEFVAIMGPSGSGKSTLMHILGLLDRATVGDYLLKGGNVKDLTDEALAETRLRTIGFIFQAFNLLPRQSALENVKLPLVYNREVNITARAAKAQAALEAVGLGHRLNFLANQLSGGEKQRVAIARALVNDPDIIFADEPTGNLDSKSGEAVMEILEKLNDSGKTIILVTHEKDTAEHAKRVIKIRDGMLAGDEMVENRRLAKDGLQK
ncbi:MAG: ABC transporter ATP-binding protein [Patescibacteria group bacterium]|jgi:putative ABC transport system ATP-binding protein